MELRGPLRLLLLLGFLALVVPYAAHEFFAKRESPLAHAEWKSYAPGQARLSLLLPDEPRAADGTTAVTDSTVLRVNRSQVTVGKFHVSLWEVFYREGTSVDLQQAASQVRTALQDSGEVTDYQEKLIPTKRYGRDGLLVSGTCKRNGELWQFRALLMAEGDRGDQVVVAFPDAYPLAARASQRVIDSVRLN